MSWIYLRERERKKVLEQSEDSELQTEQDQSVRDVTEEPPVIVRHYYIITRLPSMHYSQRLDQRLHVLRQEVKNMTQERERGEQVWKERLQRCQRQLKAKEEDLSRQSQYFENFKAQLQQKLSLARDREQNLQSRIYTLEKQLLDMTVSAATGMTKVSAARITSETVRRWEERERLPQMRGEGEGEEEKMEERRKQCQANDGNSEKKTEECQTSNEERMQGFIVSLQEDLRVLLEREEAGVTERRGLMEQLNKAQENSHFLGCKVEEKKAEVHQLKESENSLMEEVEELREENQKLQQIIRNEAKQTSSCRAVCSVPSNTFPYNTAKGCPSSGEEAAAESTHTNTGIYSPSNKLETPPIDNALNPLCHTGPKAEPDLKTLSLSAETLDEFNLGTWCSGGILNLEESPSEESDALRDAYRSLGFGDDLEKCDSLEVALQKKLEQQKVTAQGSTQLKLRKDEEEEKAEEATIEQIKKIQTRDGAEIKTILVLAQDDLVQALNLENQALAHRIQELLAHIELREEEMKKEETQLREFISKMKVDTVRWEQENQEQCGLITELTKKTEDDLNTIMELQQRLAELKHPEESQVEKEGCKPLTSFKQFPNKNFDYCLEELVESMLKEEEPKIKSSQEIENSTCALAPVCEQINHYVLQNNQQSSAIPSSLPDEVIQLTRLVQSLKTEQEDVLGHIKSLREQQRDVAMSVKTQTDEKQQLTRAVWGLKEEKDGVFLSLTASKQEKEQLTRIVCGLKEERDQFVRSMSGLKEEKEQLTKCLPGLNKEKEMLLESLLSVKEERDQIMQSLQCLQTEREQFSRLVLDLKQERDEIADALKCIKEQRDKEQSFYTLKEEQAKLIKTLSSLREDKERIEHSVGCLKEEENRLKLLLQGLREKQKGLQAAEKHQAEANRSNVNTISTAKTKETPHQSDEQNENPGQEQRDLLQEIEALRLQLKKPKDELDKSLLETLRSELHQSEVRREEAEIKSERAADKLRRLASATNQMEETRQENENLTNKVKELQSKLTVLVREKTEAFSLKSQTEEQHTVLAAQLKAKTAALEELNSEFIALKREQGSKEDVSAVLVSLRSRYNDIRAKYNALLKKRSQSDLDLAPLKAKLSCLVLKCRERNSLLAQMMKLMHRRGCMDPVLSQQVEEQLSDAALQEYSSAFPPRSNSRDFTTGFISKFQDFPRGFTPEPNHSTPSLPVFQQCQNKLPEESLEFKDIDVGIHKSLIAESTTNKKNCSEEFPHGQIGKLERNANSPVLQPACGRVTRSPVVTLFEESMTDSSVQLSSSTEEPVKLTSAPEKSGFDKQDMTGKTSPDLPRLNVSSLSSSPLSSSPRVGLGRRLSSPEKILNLQEQLQKTLMNSFQVPMSRGRRQQPRKSLSFPAPAPDPAQASKIEKPPLSFSEQQANSPAALSDANEPPAVTNSPVAKKTLFNAVTLRSAHVTSSPSMFINHKSKTYGSQKKTPALSPKTATKSAATSESNDAQNTSTTPLISRTTSFDSDVFSCSDIKPKTAAPDSTAPGIPAAPEAIHLNTPPLTYGAVRSHDAHGLTRHSSPERSNKSLTKSRAASKTKTERPRTEAPAKVRSVEVIKTVGQSSLLIGWERPQLDELGCSNETFVYGYRVFVNGHFHKSVMSSACTKCILENVDLSVSVHISVQTLGSNGLSSDSVNNTYRILETSQ